jgi:hypothetical protein
MGRAVREGAFGMADRVLFISWDTPIAGREEAAIEAFNDSVGFYGRLQQEGRIESFDVALLDANESQGGYIALHGSAAQLNALGEDDDFRRLMIQVSLIVNTMRVIPGVTNEGVAREMQMYADAVSKVPQNA